jgi:hypothetical protein
MNRSTIILAGITVVLLLVIGGGVSALMQRSAGPGEVVVETAVTLEMEHRTATVYDFPTIDPTVAPALTAYAEQPIAQTAKSMVLACGDGDQDVCAALRATADASAR